MRDKSDVNCMRTISYVCNANCNELSNLAGAAIKEPLRPSVHTLEEMATKVTLPTPILPQNKWHSI